MINIFRKALAAAKFAFKRVFLQGCIVWAEKKLETTIEEELLIQDEFRLQRHNSLEILSEFEESLQGGQK